MTLESLANLSPFGKGGSRGIRASSAKSVRDLGRGVRLAALALAVALAGCASMAPEYTRPVAPVPAAWPTGPASKGGAGVAAGAPVPSA
jgi:hypothetical protein